MTTISDVEKWYAGDTEIDRIYLGSRLVYDKERVNPLFFTNFLRQSNWMANYSPGAAKLLGQKIEATVEKPGLVSGCTFTSWRDGANISWPNSFLELLADQGTINFTYKPNFVTAPQEDIILLKISDPDITVTYTTAGNIDIVFDGLKTLSHSFVFPITTTKIGIGWVFDDDPNNKIELYLDETLVASETGFSNITRGSVTASYISNYITCNSFDEGGKGGPLYIYSNFEQMTLEGVAMTLETVPMFLGA